MKIEREKEKTNSKLEKDSSERVIEFVLFILFNILVAQHSGKARCQIQQNRLHFLVFILLLLLFFLSF
jgi:hypothetical protein